MLIVDAQTSTVRGAKRRISGLLLALVAVIEVGCSAPQEAGAPQVTIADSAGIRIVENTGAALRLPVREAYRIGRADGDPDLLFDQIRAIAVGRDGTFWVSDSHESVRRYSAEGVYLGSAGGAGDGPGESSRGYGEVLAADSTVYAEAYSSRALQLFAFDGTYLGSRRLFPQGVSLLVPIGPRADGWWFREVDFPDREQRSGRETWTVYRGPGIGNELTPPIASLPGYPAVWSGHGWGFGSYFDGFPSLATAPRGGLYYSHPTEYQIDVLSETGALVARIRRLIDRRPYPRGLDAEVEEELRAQWRRTHSRRVDEEEVRLLLDAALPDSDARWLPAIDLLLASHEGSFWVRRADLHPRPGMRAVAAASGLIPAAWPDDWRADWDFDLFADDGRYRGSVTLPVDFTPMAVSGDNVYGVIRDELDVEYVGVFDVIVPT